MKFSVHMLALYFWTFRPLTWIHLKDSSLPQRMISTSLNRMYNFFAAYLYYQLLYDFSCLLVGWLYNVLIQTMLKNLLALPRAGVGKNLYVRWPHNISKIKLLKKRALHLTLILLKGNMNIYHWYPNIIRIVRF